MSDEAFGGEPEARATGSPALGRYRRWVAGIAVGVFYSNIALFLSATGSSPVPPMAVVALFALLALPLTVQPAGVWRVSASPLAVWAVAANILAVVGFLNSSQSQAALDALTGIFGGTAFLLLMVFLLADEDAHRVARHVLLGCTLVSVGVNVFDVSHPLSFSPIVGRAAGLYLNPNISAFALVLGMAVTIGDVASKLRSPYILAIGLGVGLTMSRAGIILWAFLVIVLIAQGAVRSAGIIIYLLAFTTAAWAWIVLGGYLDLVVAALGGYGDTLLGRFALSEAAEDVSTQTRYAVALAALRLVEGHPLLGAGLGATTEWALPTASHNMYLRLTAELGLVGGLLYPAMVLSATRNVDRQTAWRFVPLWLMAGLFSHNLLEERPELVVLAMLGAATVMNRKCSPTLAQTGSPDVTVMALGQHSPPGTRGLSNHFRSE